MKYSVLGKCERCIQHFGQNSQGRDNMGDLGTDGRLVSKWILEKWGVKGV